MKLIRFLNSRNWTIGYILIASIFAIALVGCANSKIYQTPETTCTWEKVEELIVCKGESKP